MNIIFGFSAKNWLKIRYYMLNLEKSADQCNHKTQGEWKIHSGNTITYHKTQGEWKIHLPMAINFTSSKDSDDTRTTHTKSDAIEIIMGSKIDKIIEEVFESLLHRYQKGLEESMKVSEVIFDSVDVLKILRS